MSLRSFTSRVASSIESLNSSQLSHRIRPNRRSNTFFRGQIYYTQNHEWIQLASACELPDPTKINPQNQNSLSEKISPKIMARIGVSDYRALCAGDFYKVALDQLDLEFQDVFIKGREVCEIDTSTDLLESFRMPVTARITNINTDLLTQPLLANRDPENQGWLAEVEIMDYEQLSGLMSKGEYEDFLRRTPGCFTLSCEI